jgi:antitoxin ParD1/3/4
MTTLNVSMPESMRAYVEAQAASGSYSASEYLRHLIREDQRRKAEQQHALLSDFLAVAAHQLDAGDTVELTPEAVLAKGRARRKRRKP